MARVKYRCISINLIVCDDEHDPNNLTGPSKVLNFTTPWANSADNKLIFFLSVAENWLRHFMQFVSSGDKLHGMSRPVFVE